MDSSKQPVNRIFKLVIVALTLAAATGGLYVIDGTAPPALRLQTFVTTEEPGLYRVTAISDGDTIEVDLGGYRDTVRLIGVDTPETHDPRKSVQCFGAAASKFTADTLNGHKVRLVADPADSDRDKYQRLLRYVYTSDGLLLNAELIRRGYGFAYTIFPYAKLEEFRALEQLARAEGKGLWSSCAIDEAKEVKQTAPVAP